MCFKILDLTNIVSLTVALLLSNVSSSPSGPSLKDLQSKKCPEQRPTLCIPYGACCNYSEFCYAGICESCFPEEAVKSDLLKWCRERGQHTVSFMRDNSCRFACQNRFTSPELTVFNDTIFYDERYEKAKDLQIEHKGYTPDAFGLTAFILVILLMLMIIIYIKGKCLIQKLKTKTMSQQKSKAATTVETDLECASSQEIDCNDNKTKSRLTDSKLEHPADDVKNSSLGQEKNPFIKTENVDNIQPTNVIQPKGIAMPEGDLYRPNHINFCKKCLNSNLMDMDDYHDDCKELMDIERDLIKKRHKGTIKSKDQEGDFEEYCPYKEPAESFTIKKKRACEAFGSVEEIKRLMDKSQGDAASHLQSPSISSLNAVSPTEEKLFVDSLGDSSKGMYQDIEVHLEDKSSAKEHFPVLQRNESKPPAKGIEILPEGPVNRLDGESNLSQADIRI
ncbi:uncharacterized protein LOC106074417 isoform X1 [Biomphalaria glabrata]|uniref:Uncharacterized protein LOC106074417 isoform X1 n=2 Tax=Biomphalaria glabrata TaxID=6526 RepID=A0A9U8EKG0_BIOGL|nr:uncharacterized protein LOC106074417 isoform X1 [Biomphalaria glabrata]